MSLMHLKNTQLSQQLHWMLRVLCVNFLSVQAVMFCLGQWEHMPPTTTYFWYFWQEYWGCILYLL